MAHVWRGFAESAKPVLKSSSLTALPSLSALRLCDVGFNASDDMFEGEYHGKKVHAPDFSLVLERAASLGVESVLCTAGYLEEVRRTMELCRTHGEQQRAVRLLCTAGVHPTRCNVFVERGVESVTNELAQLIEEAQTHGVLAALGECGLDYDRLHFCGKDAQRIGFEAQLSLAERFHLPLFLHDRNTQGDFLAMVASHPKAFSAGGVVHSFTGSLEEMRAYIELGLYIGINGCSLKTEENLQVVKEIPRERILLETDAPWCGIRNTHASHRFVSTQIPSVKKEKFAPGLLVKDRSEPCQLLQVLEVVAAVRGENVVSLAEQVHQNTRRLFPNAFKESN